MGCKESFIESAKEINFDNIVNETALLCLTDTRSINTEDVRISDENFEKIIGMKDEVTIESEPNDIVGGKSAPNQLKNIKHRKIATSCANTEKIAVDISHFSKSLHRQLKSFENFNTE